MYTCTEKQSEEFLYLNKNRLSPKPSCVLFCGYFLWMSRTSQLPCSGRKGDSRTSGFGRPNGVNVGP